MGGQAQEVAAEEDEEVEADGGTPASAGGGTPAEARTVSPEEATPVAAAANGDVKMADAPVLEASMPLQLHACQYCMRGCVRMLALLGIMVCTFS